MIQDYCRRAQKQGNNKCIWLCFKRGRRVFATDVRLDNIKSSLGIHTLREHNSWGKRHSFYSAVTVKAVKVRDFKACISGDVLC